MKDLKLPDMDGAGFFNEMISARPNLWGTTITGCLSSKTMERALTEQPYRVLGTILLGHGNYPFGDCRLLIKKVRSWQVWSRTRDFKVSIKEMTDHEPTDLCQNGQPSEDGGRIALYNPVLRKNRASSPCWLLSRRLLPVQQSNGLESATRDSATAGAGASDLGRD